jgi:hypothetical protein
MIGTQDCEGELPHGLALLLVAVGYKRILLLIGNILVNFCDFSILDCCIIVTIFGVSYHDAIQDE